MSSREMHQTVGIVAGAAAVFGKNESAGTAHAMSDYVGGIIGGYFGSKLPDIIDPPTSPNHRSIGHGLVQNTVLLKWLAENIGTFREHCFQKAKEYEEKAKSNHDSPFLELMLNLMSEAYKFVAGLALGVIAGHVSHLALDCSTPKSLPILI